ncbi:MAG: hypothetical protein DRR08_10045 [Candidatus Parabeggiatoa sp. nov. 2]|nr:MAG: hypothetical protein B6247_31425 [Beggiatoa sp. 4572_84]RKZ60932.1 MAG: hypothetical protein DRR08_10045 [Gammaproteobacteria bacterium]
MLFNKFVVLNLYLILWLFRIDFAPTQIARLSGTIFAYDCSPSNLDFSDFSVGRNDSERMAILSINNKNISQKPPLNATDNVAFTKKASLKLPKVKYLSRKNLLNGANQFLGLL